MSGGLLRLGLGDGARRRRRRPRAPARARPAARGRGPGGARAARAPARDRAGRGAGDRPRVGRASSGARSSSNSPGPAWPWMTCRPPVRRSPRVPGSSRRRARHASSAWTRSACCRTRSARPPRGRSCGVELRPSGRARMRRSGALACGSPRRWATCSPTPSSTDADRCCCGGAAPVSSSASRSATTAPACRRRWRS